MALPTFASSIFLSSLFTSPPTLKVSEVVVLAACFLTCTLEATAYMIGEKGERRAPLVLLHKFGIDYAN
jgi:hypothetical protein